MKMRMKFLKDIVTVKRKIAKADRRLGRLGIRMVTETLIKRT